MDFLPEGLTVVGGAAMGESVAVPRVGTMFMSGDS